MYIYIYMTKNVIFSKTIVKMKKKSQEQKVFIF